jgi:hypothetical protein
MIFFFKKLKAMVKGQVCVVENITATIRDAKTGKIKRIYKHKNLVATVGRSVLAQRLANITTYTGIVNYGALGTSTTPPSNADTQLGAEVYRKAVGSNSAINNIATITFFYNTTETSGNYKEFATFIDGVSTPNSGQLFSHVAVDWTKTTSETLTVECTYTIS